MEVPSCQSGRIKRNPKLSLDVPRARDLWKANAKPFAPDTNGDGVGDCADVNQLLTPSADQVSIKLRVRDSGKVNNAQNCAICHPLG